MSLTNPKISKWVDKKVRIPIRPQHGSRQQREIIGKKNGKPVQGLEINIYVWIRRTYQYACILKQVQRLHCNNLSQTHLRFYPQRQ